MVLNMRTMPPALPTAMPAMAPVVKVGEEVEEGDVVGNCVESGVLVVGEAVLVGVDEVVVVVACRIVNGSDWLKLFRSLLSSISKL